MKYIFKNIGPIKNAELELGNLTVIAGANNTGKTYTAYMLYGFRKYIKYLISRDMFEIGGFYQKEFSDEESGGNIVKGTIPSPTLVQCVNDYLKRSAKSFSPEHIADIFAAPKEMFINSSVEIMMEETNVPKGFSESGIGSSPMGRVQVDLSEDNGVIKYKIEFGGNRKLASEESSEKKIHVAHVFVMRTFLRKHLIIPQQDFILPAERFGISLFYKELDFAKSRLVEALQKWSDKDKKQKSHIPLMLGRSSARYALPIKDNIDWTRDLDEISKRISLLSEEKLFDNIKHMMDGYYRNDGDEIFFVSRSRGENSYRIPLHMASSSARELSSLYFYLKHQASPKGLIIVDEPESHLDTKNQIQMARLLVQCVNLGMRVLITTHSDYIVQELNNMIMLHSAPDNQKIQQLCKTSGYNKKHHSLDKNKVKGYLCKKGGLESCKVDDRGMDLKWFEQPIKQINHVSNTLDSYIPEDEE